VSLAATIENSLGVAAAIKWPNDISVGARKVAGILAESGTDVNGRPFAVVGIGVNVNHAVGDFPPELATKAGSLSMATGRLIDRPTLAAHLLQELDAHISLVDSAFPKMIAEAARRSTMLGRWVQVQAGHHILEGRAEELDPDGHLLLRCSDGSLTRLTAGEVTIIAN
jgi:BirA family biotin operon repressor/biotin-[acetyl-CoA-carboxylase] ligase